MCICNDGRKLLVNIKVNGKHYSIVNLYAPNDVDKRSVFLKKSQKWINQNVANESQIFIAGDLNTTLDAIDRKNGKLDVLSKHLLSFF